MLRRALPAREIFNVITSHASDIADFVFGAIFQKTQCGIEEVVACQQDEE
jgi:hypothetical protein